GSCCIASGSDEIKKAIDRTVAQSNMDIHIKHVGYVGMCHQVPLMEVISDNEEPQLYAKVQPEDVKTIIEKHFTPKGVIPKLKQRFNSLIDNVQTDRNWEGVDRYEIDVREQRVASFLDNQVPIATEQRGVLNPLDFDEYLSLGGFKGLEQALKLQPEAIIQKIKDSGIRGRGGGGFSTGIKWERVHAQQEPEKYIICNGDEGDPGAFMDRMLLESYPFRVIEGILIGAFTLGIQKGYFYIRAEYPLAVSRITKALEICKEKGYLGKGIMGSDFNFEISIVEGAGAFVCGEETALIASIEGKRGYPTIRPPYPAVKGLRGKPTLVNNTETFAQIPYILHKGEGSFAAIGTDNSKGTKVFALAGKIERGGLIEVPMGMTIREIVEKIGGGVANGKSLKAVQIGGPSGACIPHWLADTPIDFNSLTSVGGMMGSGGLVVLDETDCMVDIARYFLSFTQHESCGKCTFCRIGTKRMLDILTRICDGKGKESDLSELKNLAGWVKKGSLCGLGRTAPNPVLSTLNYFEDEYRAHIEGKCPTGKCKNLIKYTVNDECIGCTKCAQVCPVEAIAFKPHEKHEVNQQLCIQCDSCRLACPVDAIDIV
ncbi:MAG: 4Fe-4S binding protein, partial [Bacteroidales bacterium]|nr:4Fe-4S binding protein [Bacteroidales bacterium]